MAPFVLPARRCGQSGESTSAVTWKTSPGAKVVGLDDEYDVAWKPGHQGSGRDKVMLVCPGT